MTLDVRVLTRGVRDVDPGAWDALVGDGSPFVEHAYLRACEAASATAAHGVEPRHVTLWDGDRLVAAAPLYLKRDGRGEFIYDFAWEGLARRLRVPYLPKLVSMGPFAPFDVPHLLGGERAALLDAVEGLLGREAHGLHWLFVDETEAPAFEARGYARRSSLHLVWENPGATTFDGWLETLRSKDRVRARRELRRVEEAGWTIERVERDEVRPADLEQLRRWYEDTCARHGTGSDYLKPGTWELLARDWRGRLVLFFARERGARIGGALCVEKGDALYGRYWGSEGERPFLYFALCLHRPIQHALERGLRLVHPGAGVSFHKVARGFRGVARASFHRVADPRLQRVLETHAAAEALEVDRAVRELGG